MDPLAKGVFGGDARKLSIRSCLPLLWHYERERGSVIKGWLASRRKKEKPPASLYTFKGGMERLPQELARRLDIPIVLSKTVASLEEIEADCVISALPTSALASLIGCEDPVTYASLSLVHCGWEGDLLKKRGYGFLVPTKEKSPILGMTWDSEIFPIRKGQTQVCVMIGGIYPEEELRKIAYESLQSYLGITKPPDVFYINVAQQAIPQYTLYHEQRIEAFKKRLPPHVRVIGNSYEGVGINDCITCAKRCVDGLFSLP